MTEKQWRVIRQLIIGKKWWCMYRNNRIIMDAWGHHYWLEILVDALQGFIVTSQGNGRSVSVTAFVKKHWQNRGGADFTEYCWIPDEGTHGLILRWIIRVMESEEIFDERYTQAKDVLKKYEESFYENRPH